MPVLIVHGCPFACLFQPLYAAALPLGCAVCRKKPRRPDLASNRQIPIVGGMTKDALGNVTFYTLLARWPGEIRLFTVEHPLLESEDDVIAALPEHPRVTRIFRHDDDTPRRDVTGDIALRLYHDWTQSHDLERETLPGFIADNIPAHLYSGWQGDRDAAE